MLEIIATSIADVINISKTTATNIELCANIDQDGLTPDLKMVNDALRVSKKRVRVMVRPRDSFITNDQEVAQMVDYINAVKKLNHPSLDGFVCGYLKNQQLDVVQMKKLIIAAKPYKITLHKASDLIKIKPHLILELGIDQILTQGGENKVLNNIDYLTSLAQEVNVLVGGGIDEEVFKVLKANELNIHIGRLARQNNSYRYPIDRNKIEGLNV